MPNPICPLCGQTLATGTSPWRCPNGHCFDVARQGYVNLLPVQQKHARHPGDTPAQVAARKRFLDAGFYAPIRCELADKSYTFLDFTKEADGYHYSFEKPDQSYEIIPEYFSTTVWDGAVDISWYDETKDAFYLDTPAQLAGLAALVCGNVDIDTPDYRIKGDQKNLVSTKVDDYLLIGAGAVTFTTLSTSATQAMTFLTKPYT